MKSETQERSHYPRRELTENAHKGMFLGALQEKLTDLPREQTQVVQLKKTLLENIYNQLSPKKQSELTKNLSAKQGKVLQARLERGLTRAETANELGISQKSVREIEGRIKQKIRESKKVINKLQSKYVELTSEQKILLKKVLSPKQKLILALRYSKDGKILRQQTEVAKITNLSINTIKRHERVITQKLATEVWKGPKLGLLVTKTEMQTLFNVLTPTELEHVRLRFLSGEIKTTHEVAALMNVTRNTINHRERKILKKLTSSEQTQTELPRAKLTRMFDGKSEEEQRKILSSLSQEQAKAIILRLGLFGNEPRTQNETAKAIGISRPALAKRERYAIQMLEEDMHPPIKEKLESLDEEARKNFFAERTPLEIKLLNARLGLNGDKSLSRKDTADTINLHIRLVARKERALLKALTKPEARPKKAREPRYASLFIDKTQAIKHLSKLDEEGQLIAAYRLGLNGEKPMYQSEVAKLIGKSHSYVSIKEKEIFEKLKALSEKEAEPITLFDAKSAA